jgi:hypothetical protein
MVKPCGAELAMRFLANEFPVNAKFKIEYPV